MKREITILVIENGKEIAKRDLVIPEDNEIDLNQLVVSVANQDCHTIYGQLGLINI